MDRIMIFIDHLNFEIACSHYYEKYLQVKSPKLDYNRFPLELTNELVGRFPNARLVRTYVFVPRPDEFLLTDPLLKQYYDWVNGTLKNIRYMEIVEGEYIARPTGQVSDMTIENPRTFYKVEKGTDVNIATYMLTLAFYNAYDVAVLLSADSDYRELIKAVKRLGKNVIIVGVYGQNLLKLKKEADDILILKEDFFHKCLRTNKK